jgi:hypothetical protein
MTGHRTARSANAPRGRPAIPAEPTTKGPTMHTLKEYPIGTLAQMAEIPDDGTRERFLAELPLILKSMEQMRGALSTLASDMRAKAPWIIRLFASQATFERIVEQQLQRGAMLYKDDDKGMATITMRVSEGDQEPFYRRSEKMEGGQ